MRYALQSVVLAIGLLLTTLVDVAPSDEIHLAQSPYEESGRQHMVAYYPAQVTIPGNPFSQSTPPIPPKHPETWVYGNAKLTGSREAVLGAYRYAEAAAYEFAATDQSINRLVTTGFLVELTGPNLRLVDVSQPFVLPVVKQFANRLADQYAEEKCGKLVVTSATRSVEFQNTLNNGSSHSVHPTGMALDFRRFSDGSDGSQHCLNWLQSTLQSIEASGRIDATREKNPSHFHVVVVPHAYEAWLASR